MSNQLAVIEKTLETALPTFRQLVPQGVIAERIMRTVVTSIERDRTGKLIRCTPTSILQSACTGAVLGLEADGVTGQGFLVPFFEKSVLKAQWITGYRGYPTLGARSDLTIAGAVVREGDEFDYELGTRAFVSHKPKLGNSLGRRIIAGWATATHRSRAPIVVVMDVDHINAIRDRVLNRGKKKGARTINQDGEDDDAGFSPWRDEGIGYSAMARKTPIRGLAPFLPLTPFTLAARIDEAHEEQGQHAFINERRELIVGGEVKPLAEEQPPPPEPMGAIKPPRFIVHKKKGDIVCSTIEDWRGKMILAIENLSRGDNLESFWDLNAAEVDRLSDEHPQHAKAVGEAYEKRRRG